MKLVLYYFRCISNYRYRYRYRFRYHVTTITTIHSTMYHVIFHPCLHTLHAPMLRQIAMSLSGRPAQRPHRAPQVQLRCGRLSERAVPAGLHTDPDERRSHHGAAWAAKMSARWQMVGTVAQMSQLRGGVACPQFTNQRWQDEGWSSRPGQEQPKSSRHTQTHIHIWSFFRLQFIITQPKTCIQFCGRTRTNRIQIQQEGRQNNVEERKKSKEKTQTQKNTERKTRVIFRLT